MGERTILYGGYGANRSHEMLRAIGSKGPSTNRYSFCELRIKQLRLGREAIAEELKYELANTQAPNYTISQMPSRDLIFLKSFGM